MEKLRQQRMPLACPNCGSRRLRHARRRYLSEYFWSLVGVHPLRCRDCRLRFTERTWRLSSFRYARCPACWRMDLNTWSADDYPASAGQLLLMQLGATPYRCEYCRVNFVSFRLCREKFSFKRWKEYQKGQTDATGTPGPGTDEAAEGAGRS